MRNKIVLLVLFMPFMVSAQMKIVLKEIPESGNLNEKIYMASNFSSWNPADSNYVFSINRSGKPELSLKEFKGELNFKITRGDWKNVECDSLGKDIDNRTLVYSDTTVEVIVEQWKDYIVSNNTSRSENVSIIDSVFVIPELNRERKVWIYLPPSYKNSNKRYPVIYMHDGQNLFDSNTSYAGEWEVDETLDKLTAEGEKEAIIVGVENGGRYRIDELTPFANKQYGGGEAKYYVDFIIKDLKKYIDNNYRSKSDRDNTFIMGSSLGGLTSFYALMSRKEVFSKAVVMSPSFWFNERIYFIPKSYDYQKVKVYFVGGELEGSEMIENIDKMAAKMLKFDYSESDVVVKKVKNGGHNEKLWKEEFKEAYLWLLNE